MRFTFTLLFCLAMVANAMAQGTIKGKITDEKTGETLVGVTILIPEKPDLAVFSDEDGNFEMKVPTDGNYTVQLRYMGYSTKEISDVKIENGTITPIAVAMKEEGNSNNLEAVVIRSTLKRESLNALYIAQKNAATVSDGISAEAIQKSPDKSTGEVLKRVSGTTIQDNKFVIIRGLTDRYNTALIDNSFLPSTEPNRKAFSFDIIPSNLIDNIIISKSGTPDLPGDFAGGVINILTKEVPEKNFNSISIGSAYNTVSTFKKFETGYKSPTDILGFDNGARKLPSTMPSFNYFQQNQFINKDQSAQYLSTLNNNYSVTNRKALPATSIQGSMGRLYELKKNRRIGMTAAINYTHNETVKRDVNRFYGNYYYVDQVYNYSTNIGGLANMSYVSGNTKISFKNLYNRTFDDNYLYREGYDGSSSNYLKYHAFDLIQKSLFKSSIEGQHTVGDDAQKKIDWVLSYNNVTNNQPDQRKVQFQSATEGSNYGINLGTVGRVNNRLFGNLNESIINTAVNYTTPYKVKFLYKSNLKVGVLALYRYRDFENRYFGATLDPAKTLPENTNLENVFSNTNVQNKLFNFVDQTAKSDLYTATAFTKSAYIMSDNRINTRLRAVWGLRFESYDLNLQSPELTFKKQTINPVWNDFLPSLNLTYALTEKSNLRMSYFRSVARPEMREVAPIGYYDYELNLAINGNENLTRSRIDNIDLRYELFSKPGEVLSGSVFYKKFDKTIENEYLATGSPEVKTINYNSAYAAGVEVELRKNLAFIAPNNFFKNLTFYSNVSVIKSEVQLSGTETKYINTTRTVRPLSGQSNYVINASLSYSAFDSKLNMNILYNRIGKRIFLVGGNGQFGDVYENPRNILDFQASFAVSKKSEFRLNIKDIFNAPTLYYYDQNDNKKWDNPTFDKIVSNPSNDFILQKYKQGTTFSLTYTYKF